MRKKMNRTRVIILIVAALTVAVPSLIVYSFYDRARKGDQLYTSIIAGNTAKALLLLKSGADPNYVYRSGTIQFTPMDVACNGRDVLVVRYLLSYGVKPWVAGKDKASLIRRTLENWDSPRTKECNEIMQMLIDHGADVNAVTEDDDMPIIFAISSPQNGAVKFLIDHGADVNLTPKSRFSPLDVASTYGNTFALRLLLKSGADPSKSGDTFEKLIEVAQINHNKEIVAILKDAMAKRKAAATTGPKK